MVAAPVWWGQTNDLASYYQEQPIVDVRSSRAGATGILSLENASSPSRLSRRLMSIRMCSR